MNRKKGVCLYSRGIKQVIFLVVFVGLMGWCSVGWSKRTQPSVTLIEDRHVGLSWNPSFVAHDGDALKLDIWLSPRWGVSTQVRIDSPASLGEARFSGLTRWQASTGSSPACFATAQLAGGLIFSFAKPSTGLTASASGAVGCRFFIAAVNLLEGHIHGELQSPSDPYAQLSFTLGGSITVGYDRLFLIGARGGGGYSISSRIGDQPIFFVLEVFLMFRFESFLHQGKENEKAQNK